MAALALARPVGSRGTAPGLTNPEQYALAWMPHRHERRFSPRDESEEGDAVGFVEIRPDEALLPAVARLGKDRESPRVVRRRTPAHHDLRPRMRSVEVADGQIVGGMQAPGGALARGEDEFAGPPRPPAARFGPAAPARLPKSSAPAAVRPASPTATYPGGPGRRATLHAPPSQNTCLGLSAEKYTSLPGVRGPTSPPHPFSGMRAVDS